MAGPGCAIRRLHLLGAGLLLAADETVPDAPVGSGAAAAPVIDPVGGQAVVEGVMMRAPGGVGLAVRLADGGIHAEFHDHIPWRRRLAPLAWPVLRGAAAMVEALSLGMKMLDRSLELTTGERSGKTESAFSLLVGLLVAVALFMVLPAWIHGQTPLAWHPLARAAVEGGVRLGLFVGYVALLGRHAEVATLYAYHGAEHQVIHAHEAGLGETVEAARGQSPRHPRCGTSFLFLTAVVGIVVFAMIPRPEALEGALALGWRVGAKLLLLPVVAGLSFELIRAAGRGNLPGAGFLPRFALSLTAPGQWLQRLTTRRAADGQLEVAVAALAVARRGR
ncbi:MAG: DUF1385 domain-containing protein [Candidatus Sericytochromatia bacterium]|nr:DUF1385 domain-containing protein [Candidatus Sericytochromatia bacterium]